MKVHRRVREAAVLAGMGLRCCLRTCVGRRVHDDGRPLPGDPITIVNGWTTRWAAAPPPENEGVASFENTPKPEFSRLDRVLS